MIPNDINAKVALLQKVGSNIKHGQSVLRNKKKRVLVLPNRLPPSASANKSTKKVSECADLMAKLFDCLKEQNYSNKKCAQQHAAFLHCRELEAQNIQKHADSQKENKEHKSMEMLYKTHPTILSKEGLQIKKNHCLRRKPQQIDIYSNKKVPSGGRADNLLYNIS